MEDLPSLMRECKVGNAVNTNNVENSDKADNRSNADGSNDAIHANNANHKNYGKHEFEEVDDERSNDETEENTEEKMPDPNELRLLANSRFAANALEEALPIYGLAVDVSRKQWKKWKRFKCGADDDEGGTNELEKGGEGEEWVEPELVIHLCNRSACLYKMEMYEEAKDDALEAVEVSKGRNSKAFFRLARAQFALGEYASGMETIQRALHHLDEDIKQRIQDGGETDNLEIQKSEFHKLQAIATRKQQESASSPHSPHGPNSHATNGDGPITSIKFSPITPSIKEFNRPSKSLQYTDSAHLQLGNLGQSKSDNVNAVTAQNVNPLLGEGNFSTVVMCTHKQTHEIFALKIIEKEACNKLAKRQHPNVHNEVMMERRILVGMVEDNGVETVNNADGKDKKKLKRLPWHTNIIHCYHAMQDYGNLYFLMELHAHQGGRDGDLWSKIRYKNPYKSDGENDRYCMVGCPSNLIRIYAYELLSAIEHCHRHGIVHRDIKPENVLLSRASTESSFSQGCNGGHVVLIDFGTAKDLIYTDLNGPEFVGTPDFMSPEAVKEFDKNGNGCDFTADLWAFGVVLYQMYSGKLPFEAASPYLAFLKIQRCVFSRSMGLLGDEDEDDAWDLIKKLLRVRGEERLGAGAFEWIAPRKSTTEVGEAADTDNQPGNNQTRQLGKVIEHGKGYDVIREHPFFAKHKAKLLAETNCHLDPYATDATTDPARHLSDQQATPSHQATPKPIPQPIPSLRSLALISTAHFLNQATLDIDLEEKHPPGDGSKYDALRLKEADRRRLMHILDRLKMLKEPRIFRRFFRTRQEARLSRIRPLSHDVLGLTQINDRMGQFPGRGEEESHPDRWGGKAGPESVFKEEDGRICIHQLSSPLFSRSIHAELKRSNDDQISDGEVSGDVKRKEYIKQLKDSIRLINRKRPKVVVATGTYFDETCKKLLSKVNESVPVILHDGSSYFHFWVCGAHCLAARLEDLKIVEVNNEEGPSSLSRLSPSVTEAQSWLRMELEQIKTARSPGYVFVDGDPREISPEWMAKLGKSHVLGVLGSCDDQNGRNEGSEGNVGGEGSEREWSFESKYVVAEHQERHVTDNISVSSSESEEEDEERPPDEHVMAIAGRSENGVRCIVVEEEDCFWNAETLL